ncbi:methyltransferase type 11 [Novosphingobium sp. YJ-S2-02]|uniref:Methyltransferase type 11 n=1 Tax=Novosphingobium aureum TaxID=2792964 RepID=A0A931HD41_9SPHN|nr:methyltransferase type 11 [Novosphingobium aureum]MBH0113226.1 methyltransferase type 11 [Novosphingobium aureum]
MKADVYRRPLGKVLRIPVRRREDFAAIERAQPVEVVAVDRATECHVTPPDVAARMVSYLGRIGDMQALEPSAGTGNLSRAMIEAGHSRFELTQVERHHKLAGMLHGYGSVIHRCFLDYAEEARGKVEFVRVIMNPPFREVRKHVAAAVSLMGRNGHDCPACLVALVPVTFHWDGAEELERLPVDTFAAARVHTKIIRIYGA